MYIAEHMKAKLKGTTPIYWVAHGIAYGQIKGNESELKEFILPYITDPEEIATIYGKGSAANNAIGLLFSDYRNGSEEEKKNILIAFNVLFEKNPTAIAKSAVRLIRDVNYRTQSAIESISELELLQEFEPQLLIFIREHALKLNETELRHLVYGIHDNPNLIGQLVDLFSSRDLSGFERNSIPNDELQGLILKNWYPDYKGSSEFFYQDFPTIEMWRLFMDGDQQTNGWTAYDRREPGCINQLYLGWKYVNQTMTEPLSPSYFKKIHSICAQGIVPIPGEYRKNLVSFQTSTNSMTFLGYLEHIQTYNPYCSLRRHPRLCFDAQTKIEQEELDSTIEHFIREYEAALSINSENPRLILEAIILFCKKMVLIHPFRDCNGRLFCNLILNRELIRNGFSPALLDNPNRIDGHSINESIYELVRGMENFQQLKIEGVYKDTPSTMELLKTKIYPIPELSLQQKENKSNDTTVSSNQYGWFALPTENPVKNRVLDLNLPPKNSPIIN